MKLHAKPILIGSLLFSSALVSPALAQESAQLFEQGRTCDAVTALSQENQDQLRNEWLQEARGVVQTGNRESCTLYYEQAFEALAELDRQRQGQAPSEGADLEAIGRIVISQPEPTVAIEQQPPVVTVTQPEPMVSVDQGRPEILVRQAQPTVTVEMPRPTITIDQPQPEIIVRMPEPQVAVTTPQPQVEVEMPRPEVNVDQPQPQVRLNATGEQDADIEVDRAQAIVRQVETAGEPQVDIQRQQPMVRFEAAEPAIRFEEAGEPEVRFNQSGEPNIRFENMGGQNNAAAQTPTATGNAQNQILVALQTENQQMQSAQPLRYWVRDVVGQRVTDPRGTELGTVARLVSFSGQPYLILSDGQALGMSGQQPAIPANRVVYDGAVLIVAGLSDNEIQTLRSGQAAQAQELGGSEQVEIRTQQ